LRQLAAQFEELVEDFMQHVERRAKRLQALQARVTDLEFENMGMKAQMKAIDDLLER
jgi:hypothetical protein